MGNLALPRRHQLIKSSHRDERVIRRLDFSSEALASISTASPKLRPRCRFIDDSAIESDGEGGDIPSDNSDAEEEFAPPLKTEPISKPFALPPLRSKSVSRPPTSFKPLSVEIKPIVKKKPNTVLCNLCRLSCLNLKQLEAHRGGRKCRNRSERQIDHICGTCRKSFDTLHNLTKHKRARKHK